MEVVVPFASTRPKTRLSDVLTAGERREFARAMLADVLGSLDAVRLDGERPGVRVLATAPLDVATLPGVDAGGPADEALDDVAVTVDERPLTPAVDDVLAAREPTPDDPLAVVMSDLALATPRTLSRLFAATGDVVVAPGLGGGTNALVVRHPEFRVDYHGASYLDHLDAARAVGASVRDFDSRRLAVDVDEPSDLAEVLIHGGGASRAWLGEAGFRLDVDGGRVGVRREE